MTKIGLYYDLLVPNICALVMCPFLRIISAITRNSTPINHTYEGNWEPGLNSMAARTSWLLILNIDTSPKINKTIPKSIRIVYASTFFLRISSIVISTINNNNSTSKTIVPE